MNCSQARNLFDAYLNEELTGALATEFGAHQLRCSACRRELALLEVAGHVVACDTDGPALPDDFTDRLLACALNAPPASRSRRRTALFAGAPLAAAAGLALLLTVWHSQASGSRSPSPSVVPQVLMGRDDDRSPEAVRERVETALTHHPDNPQLRELAEALRVTGEEIVESSKDTANLLENLGEETIMGILKSLPLEGTPAADPAQTPAPESEQSVDDHDATTQGI